MFIFINLFFLSPMIYNHVIFFFFFIFIAYMYELLDYYLSALNCNLFNFNLFNFNLFLSNNLNKIHPFFLYVSILIIFYLFAVLFRSIVSKARFLAPALITNLTCGTVLVFFFIFNALILGA